MVGRNPLWVAKRRRGGYRGNPTRDGYQSTGDQACLSFCNVDRRQRPHGFPIGRPAAKFHRRNGAAERFVSGFASGHPVAEGNPRNHKDFDWW
jgi:hypothetical protein